MKYLQKYIEIKLNSYYIEPTIKQVTVDCVDRMVKVIFEHTEEHTFSEEYNNHYELRVLSTFSFSFHDYRMWEKVIELNSKYVTIDNEAKDEQ